MSESPEALSEKIEQVMREANAPGQDIFVRVDRAALLSISKQALRSLPDGEQAVRDACEKCGMELVKCCQICMTPEPLNWQADKIGKALVSKEILEFLCGSGPLEGVWFGEAHPTKKGAFWWRKYLNKPLVYNKETRTIDAALSEAGRKG